MQMVLRPACCRSRWHAVNLYLLLTLPHWCMTCYHPEWMHLNYCWHSHTNTDTSLYTHAHTLFLTPTHISYQSQWLLCSSLNGRPDLRYAELFPSSPNFQATGGKRIWEKWSDREHGILLFRCKTLIHFVLLPNLQGPRTTYSVMRRWVEKGSEACWEDSLQHSLQLLGETVKMQSF